MGPASIEKMLWGGEDEVFVGTDVRGVAALGHDFPAIFVLIFGALSIYRKSDDVEHERKWYRRPIVMLRDFRVESQGSHYCSW
jgi:hypothetical protein